MSEKREVGCWCPFCDNRYSESYNDGLSWECMCGALWTTVRDVKTITRRDDEEAADE